MSTTTPSLFEQWDWQPPKSWQKVTTIDTHTGGEPLRIVTSGLPNIEGVTVLEKRRYFMEHYDHLRTGLLREPRGHADQYGAILSLAADDADLDVFFLNTEGYSPMCGHAILAIAKVAVETGLVRKPNSNSEITINVPPGRNYAKAKIVDGEVTESSFKNVPSFVYLVDKELTVPSVGKVKFDVAFGGAFYAIVDAASVGVDLIKADYTKLIDYGRKIKKAVVDNFEIKHPFEDDMSSLFGVIFTGTAHNPINHSRNVTVFEDGEVDRSSTGTGISARAALHFEKGELPLNEAITIESILGSAMTVTALQKTSFGPYEAIIPKISGTSHIIGRSELFFDPSDPFNSGFMFR